MSRSVIKSGKRLRTRQEVRSHFVAAGLTVKDWATRRGFNPPLVYQVLRGRPALRGRSHEIAVALGLKRPADRAAL